MATAFKRTAPVKKLATIVSKTGLFTVTGSVALYFLGARVTTVVQTTTNNTKFTFTPTGGSATDLCGTADLSALAVRKFFYLDGVKATALQTSTDAGIAVFSGGHMPIILGPGVINLSCSATSCTGTADVICAYEPLTDGAGVF